jgi:light-independent protochlorophyllide reductase subunit B
MFREDPEFSDDAGASHLGPGVTAAPLRHAELVSASIAPPEPTAQEDGWIPKQVQGDNASNAAAWTSEASAELRKIPFFVRGKARRNTENFAAANGRAVIDLVTLYDAKAHYGR